MMVKLLLYGYATGMFSSRKMERRLHEDLAFRMLGAGNFPKHRTIRDFRALHLKELSDLFVQVVRLAAEMGLVKLGTVAIDGTKLKANASRHKAMSYPLRRLSESYSTSERLCGVACRRCSRRRQFSTCHKCDETQHRTGRQEPHYDSAPSFEKCCRKRNGTKGEREPDCVLNC